MIKNPFSRYMIAFFLGFTGLLLLFLISHIEPFGTYQFLTSDLFHQYYIFHTWFGEVLRSGEWNRLLYEFNAGLGHSMLGTYAYYLSSPFSLLSAFFNEETMPLGITLILALKIGAISTSFYWFLTTYFKKHQTWYYGFALFYAFSGFSVTYLMNFMWLDQLIMLPLLCYSGLLWLHQKRVRPLLICLILSFWVNFYTAYMSGVFLALFLFVEFFKTHAYSEWKSVLKMWIRLAGLALLSFGALGWFLLPALYQLLTPGGAELSFEFNFPYQVFELLETLLVGFYDGVQTDDLPPLYFGILPLILAIAFFFQSSISSKERHLHLALFCFLGVSFMINPLYNFWHGFKSPVWFSGRHAFVLAFYGLFLGARTFHTQLQKPNPPAIWRSVLVVASVYLVMYLLQIVDIIPSCIPPHSISPLILSALFLLIYVLLWRILYKPNNQLSWRVLLYIGFFEVCLSAGLMFSSFIDDLTLVPASELKNHLATSQGYLNTFQQESPTSSSHFSRYNLNQPLINNSLLIGYPGLHSFNTLNHLQTIRVLNHLTDHSQLSSATFLSSQAHPLLNSLLGVSHLFSSVELLEFYSPLSSENLYHNPYALPLGFHVSNEVNDLNLSKLNGVDSQNQLLNTLLGQSENPQNYLLPSKLNLISSSNLEFNSDCGLFESLDSTQEASLTYHIYTQSDKPTYLSFLFPLQNFSNVSVKINKEEIFDLSASNFLVLPEKEVHELTFTCEASQNCGISEPVAYQVDIDLFQEALQALQRTPLTLIDMTTNSFSGTIKTKEDGVLFTSIPYSSGWKVILDGEPVVSTPLVHHAFLGIELPAGDHSLTFTYTPPGFKEGCLLSLITLNGLTFYWVFRKAHPVLKSKTNKTE